MGTGWRGLVWLWRDQDWRSVGRTGQVVRALADPAAQINPEGRTRSGRERDWQSAGSTDKPDKRRGAKQPAQPKGSRVGNKASNL